jgi:hypothetical protein
VITVDLSGAKQYKRYAMVPVLLVQAWMSITDSLLPGVQAIFSRPLSGTLNGLGKASMRPHSALVPVHYEKQACYSTMDCIVAILMHPLSNPASQGVLTGLCGLLQPGAYCAGHCERHGIPALARRHSFGEGNILHDITLQA